MQLEPKLNWILCGFKGAGKTHFASKLALPFIDTDHLIEQKEGLSIRQIVQQKGHDSFRHMEEKLLSTLDVDDHIIAIGGGTLLSPVSVSHLKALGKLIFLNAPKTLIQKRLLSPPLPTFLDLQDLASSFEKMWSTRISEYERICDFKVDLDGKSDEHVVKELWRVINLERSFESLPGENLTAKQSES